MGKKIELSLEQQFNLESFKIQVGKLNKEEAQIFLVELYTNMLIRESLYKQLMKSDFNSNTEAFNGH